MEEKKTEDRLKKLEDKMKKAMKQTPKADKIAKEMMSKLQDIRTLMNSYIREQMILEKIDEMMKPLNVKSEIDYFEKLLSDLEYKFTMTSGHLPVEDLVVQMEAVERFLNKLKESHGSGEDENKR